MALLFRTQFSEPKKVFACPGDPIKIEYGSRLDRNGNIVVEEKGKFNLSEYINSFKDSCDLSVILNKYLNGDKDVLEQRKAIYMDLTGIPTNYNDMVNLMNESKYEFDRLPIDIKKKFDNDPIKFICSIGSDEWKEKLNLGKVVNDNGIDMHSLADNKDLSSEVKGVENEQKSE